MILRRSPYRLKPSVASGRDKSITEYEASQSRKPGCWPLIRIWYPRITGRSLTIHWLPHPPFHWMKKTYLSCRDVVQLLATHGADEPPDIFQLPVSRSLLEAFLGLAARSIDAGDLTSAVASRLVQLTQAFRQLLTERVQTEKRPVAYAGYLNISETYLNQAVKSVTGFTVTYWVLHEVLLQAKRLLFHTELTIKEIAQQLGYDDPTYFSRLFKKATRTTPLAFRHDYRK